MSPVQTVSLVFRGIVVDDYAFPIRIGLIHERKKTIPDELRIIVMCENDRARGITPSSIGLSYGAAESKAVRLVGLKGERSVAV